MKCDIVKDTSTLTTIPEKTLRKLTTKIIYCICDAVKDLQQTEEHSVDLDIGIGTLSIGLINDSIYYKFTPSSELEENVKSTVLNEQNLLEDALEAALVERLTKTYKDLL